MSDLTFCSAHNAIDKIRSNLCPIPYSLDGTSKNEFPCLSESHSYNRKWFEKEAKKLWPDSKTIKFDYEQKKAIISIVHGIHGNKPYVLYGPPGYHLFKKSKIFFLLRYW